MKVAGTSIVYKVLKNKNLLVFVMLLFVFSLVADAQHSPIDSLLLLLKTDKQDTTKIKHLNKLAKEYITIADYDSSLNYANEAIKLSGSIRGAVYYKGVIEGYTNVGIAYASLNNYSKALYYFEQALKIGIKTKDKNAVADACANRGIILRDQGNYSDALENFDIALKIKEICGDKPGVAANYNRIGSIYETLGNYPEALKNFWAALEIFELVQDKRNLAITNNNIGNIYFLLHNYSKAEEYYFASLKLGESIKNKKGISASYNNLGNLFATIGNYTEALRKHNAALDIRKKMKSKISLSESYNNIGEDYLNMGEYSLALANMEEAQKVCLEVGDREGVLISFINMGKIYIRKNKLKEAAQNFNRSITIGKDLGKKELIKEAYNWLCKVDSLQENWKKAYLDYKLYSLYKDSLDNEETRKKIVENTMTHKFKQKETLLKAKQDKKDAVAAEEQQRQKTVIYCTTAGLILTLLLAFFIFRGYKQKQKANELILEKKSQVEKQKELIEEKNKQLAEKHKEITDSINYAKRIQGALLKEEEHINLNLPQHFILFLPKDVVSGDFYWNYERTHTIMENSQPKTTAYWYGCVADCTGHGVPGAMMSMLGMTMLNDIVSAGELLDPAEVLEQLRNRIITELGQTGKEGENKDGMDASIFRLNRQTNELYWAGANNALYLYQNNELIEVKADKQPVAHYAVMKPFTNKVFQLQKGDIYYLITDGYADQFGGSKNKKFKYKQLEELLAAIAPKAMNEQKAILKQTFFSWRGENEQTDDVTIAGLRV